MKDLLAFAGRFALDWFRAAIYFSSWPARITKGIGIALSLASIGLDMPLTFSLGESGPFSVPLSVAVPSLLLLLLACVALGQTIVRFKSLKIAEHVQVRYGVGTLAITNHGFNETVVPVWLARISGTGHFGRVTTMHLPMRMRWVDSGYTLSCGVPRQLLLFEWSKIPIQLEPGSSINLTHLVLCPAEGEKDAFMETRTGSPCEINFEIWIGSNSCARRIRIVWDGRRLAYGDAPLVQASVHPAIPTR